MLILLLALLLFSPLHAQDHTSHTQQHTVMFYNLENAFWPEDDPAKQDDDYTPTGSRRWSKSRLKQKLSQVEKVLLGAGKGLAPMVVGLAEVEGERVIDYCLVSGDTLDLIVCHLPSQYSGARQSQASRDAAHRTLMQLADSIAQNRQAPCIIIMGDMNETPSKRHDWWNQGCTHRWSNLMLPLQQQLNRRPGQHGTHKYQGEWSYLDQFIVLSVDSVNSLNSLNSPPLPPRLRLLHPRSFSMPFMLTDDEIHLGQRPKRSYFGSQYEGGVSDHLPIVIDLEVDF